MDTMGDAEDGLATLGALTFWSEVTNCREKNGLRKLAIKRLIFPRPKMMGL